MAERNLKIRKENETMFPEIKKNFGFGCMRLPLLENGDVDNAEFTKMVDTFIEAGFNYFDTAHGYLSGKSEIALRECLTSRHDRSEYLLANKLSNNFFQTQEEILPFFESQLALCGVEYFDFYLMHAQNSRYFEKYKACNAYEVAYELKKEGKIRHLGMSFHDSAAVLDQILTEKPFIEFVQIQLNYLDMEDAGVQSRLCYEVCRKHGKPVIIMEPVKGGRLVKLPAEAGALYDALGGGSYASYAIRYAASFEGVVMVLSGMSDMAQMNDNLSYMKDFRPMSEEEYAVTAKVCDILRRQDMIACTACRYCEEGCPKKIAIPDLFSCLNDVHTQTGEPKQAYAIFTEGRGKASDCIGCAKCEKICPQKLRIRTHLKEVAKVFD